MDSEISGLDSLAPQSQRRATMSKPTSALDMPDVPKGKLPPHLELQRTRVLCNADAPTHTETMQYSASYASMGVDNSVQFEQFSKNFKVEVIRLTEEVMEFDMVGIDPSIANAFRRILIAEVPTMAIEKVLIANNTSIIQDEVLAHRLGLIPLRVDPNLFDYLSENDAPNEKNTIVFKLHVRCERKKNDAPKAKDRHRDGGKNRLTVYSKELKWLPNGSEYPVEKENPTSSSTVKPKTYTSFSCRQDSLPEFINNPIGLMYNDITIARLGVGQEIELEAHAVKGQGKTHAKWSPVATAWYRMLPEVVLLKDVVDERAKELKNKCPVGVFEIEDIGNGRERATVARPRACTLCRECIRESDWKDYVALRRVKDHFIFTIESAGALPPEALFIEAVKILEDKCERVITDLS